MLSTRRLVIAAGNSQHAATLQNHLERALELTAPVVRFEDVAGLLTPETDGDVLLVAQDLSDTDPIEVVVREARIQRFPASFVLIESEAIRHARSFDHLLPHLAARWMWPAQIRELTSWSQRGLEPGTPFADPEHEPLEERIRRLLVHQTPSLSMLLERLHIAAAHDVPVLIEGEAGTGKTQLARLIHSLSPRSAVRFVAVGCGSLPGPLLARELFGYAPEGSAGKFLAAGSGTVLLEEIDALPPELQSSLLRVLESGEIEPVGGTEVKPCAARVIAATNWNLADAVERGAFRRDLFYRLQVVHLPLPPLRHRPEDIAPLVRAMVACFGKKYGKRLFSIGPEAMHALEANPWPGNLRQLEHVVQQAVLSSHGNELKLHHLSPSVHPHGESGGASGEKNGVEGTLKQGRESSERANILRALEKADQSRTQAAKLLGVSRVTLYKKMKKYGLFTKSPPSIPFPVEGRVRRASNA